MRKTTRLHADSDEMRRRVTVVRCDLVDSTALLSRLGLERYRRLNRMFLRSLVDVARGFEAQPIRFTGDGYAFAIGLSEASEHDALTGVRLARALVESTARLRPLGVQLTLRAAVVVDDAIVSAGEHTHDGADGQVSVEGPVLNLSARMIEHAADGNIVISTVASTLVKKRFKLADLGLHSLKGFRGRRRIWRVDAENPPPTTFDRQGLLLEREQEMLLLSDFWHKCQRGKGRSVWIRGEAGMGKSHLIGWLLAKERPANLMLLQCQPGGGAGEQDRRGAALEPVMNYLCARVGQSPAAADAASTIDRHLQATGDFTADESRLITQLLSSDEGAERASGPSVLRSRRIELLRRYVRNSARRQPLLLVVEDAHWIDQSTALLVRGLAVDARSEPILLVVTSRLPEQESLRSEGTQERHPAIFEAMALKALSRAASRKLALSVVGEAGISDQELAGVVERCDGVPLYVERVSQEYRSRSGQSVEVAQSLQPVDHHSDEGNRVPAVLFSVLMSSLDRVPDGLRIAQLASVQGRDVDLSLLAPLARNAGLEIDAPVMALINAGILERVDAGGLVRFRHHLIRDVAYFSLLASDRGELHRQTAHQLAGYDRSGLRGTEEWLTARVAAHYESAARLADADDQAGSDARSAARAWLSAARHSISRSELDESINRLDRVEGLMEQFCEDGDPESSELLLEAYAERAYAESLLRGWSVDAVRRALDRGLDLVERSGGALALHGAALDLQVIATGYHLTIGAIERAGEQGRQLLERAIELGKLHPDSAEVIRLRLTANRALSGCHCLSGAHDKALAASAEGLGEYDRNEGIVRAIERRSIGNHKVTLLIYRELSLLSIGNVSEALETAQRAVDYADEIGHSHSATHARVFRAALKIILGMKDMEDAALDARECATRHRHATWLAPAEMFVGHCQAMRQDLDAGKARIAESAEGNPDLYLPFGISLIVSAELARGSNPEPCLGLLEHALGVMQRTHEFWFRAETLRLRGLVRASIARESGRDPLPAAVADLQQAIEVARGQGARFWQLRAALSLATLMAEKEDTAHAHEHLREALAYFGGTEQFPDLVLARSLL